MKLSSVSLLATVATVSTVAPSVNAQAPDIPGAEYLGNGICVNENQGQLDYGQTNTGISSVLECHNLCRSVDTSDNLLGFNYIDEKSNCMCWWKDNTMPVDPSTCGKFEYCSNDFEGNEITTAFNPGWPGAWTFNCYRYVSNTETTTSETTTSDNNNDNNDDCDLENNDNNSNCNHNNNDNDDNSDSNNASSNGDPHFTTFHNEHFEFHGQCDVVMASVKNFVANKNIDLAIHLRTKMVRFWSYIESAAIRIGNDILEVKGSPGNMGELHYWANFEGNGELSDLAGFPVTINPNKDKYTIDLDSVYPGQKIEIKTFKEFVSVNIVGATEKSFGNSVGIIGDFKSGKTLARDRHTVIHDFNDLGLEWQVLPSDGKLFHEIATPQFPELCLLPEDPRGDRARRLVESTISVEDAEAACASLKDPLTIKDCVYDILATQDMEMVGAF